MRRGHEGEDLQQCRARHRTGIGRRRPGRDLETFQTYLAASPLRESAFLGMASEGVLVFACSTEKDREKGKIRSDVDKIMSRSEPPERIYFFSTDTVPVDKRHDLEDEVWKEYGVRLEVLDAMWLAEQLSARPVLDRGEVPEHAEQRLPNASGGRGGRVVSVRQGAVAVAGAHKV